MENIEHLTLKVGEVKLITLESRGAAGLQLTGRCDDESVVQVERKETYLLTLQGKCLTMWAARSRLFSQSRLYEKGKPK